MLVQAAVLAVLAAVSPTALLLAAVYLGSARPRTTLLLYLAGAVLMSVVMGLVVLAALRAGGFSLPRHRQDRYGLRLGLGILILIAGVRLLRRRPKPPGRDRPQKGLVPGRAGADHPAAGRLQRLAAPPWAGHPHLVR